MRLRQIALVARDLAAASADIRAVLGLDWAYADLGVGKFGLANAVFPVGTTFLEVVSPKQDGTTAGRLLDKRGGDGGYMVILQVDDIAPARARVARAGARIVEQADLDGVAMSHVHPRDVGGAILSLDWMSPKERWEWGGKGWEGHVKTDTSVAVAGAELQGDDPAAMAARWAERPWPAGGGEPAAEAGASPWTRARSASWRPATGAARAWAPSTWRCARPPQCARRRHERGASSTRRRIAR